MGVTKSLNIFWVYMLFALVGAVNFSVSLSFASPDIQSLFIIFASATIAFFILGAILAWFAQTGVKWARIMFGIYCVYRIGDYFWGHLYLKLLPLSIAGWAQAILIVCGWILLLWLVIAKGSNKQCNSDSGTDAPTSVR